MKKNFTEIVFVLDESGSMFSLTEDTIGGFNSLIKKQKKENGTAVVSTVMFSDSDKVVHDRIPLDEIPVLTDKDYCPSGCTALLDAVGGAVHHIGNIHKYARKEDIPEHTLFVIVTDGMENASIRYSAEKVKEMIKLRRQRDGWEFLFLGANIDSVETASRIGIGKETAVDYCADGTGTAVLYESVGAAMSCKRAGAVLNECSSWRKNIDSDTAKRGRRRK